MVLEGLAKASNSGVDQFQDLNCSIVKVFLASYSNEKENET